MNEVLQKISNIGIVPVVKLEDIDKAVPLAKALVEGGIPCAEVTFRAAGADQVIAKISAEVPEMLVGAGTVVSVEQAEKAIEAGAKFIVSPGFDAEVVAYCIEKGVPITPGTSNPSEMQMGMKMGLEVVKFFPAEQAGGVNYLKAVSGPYASLKFMPTGGVNAKNMNDYLSQKNVIACGGSWMVKADMIAAGDFAGITALCKEAVRTMHGFEVKHVGINCADETEAEKVAKMFSCLFGFEYKPGNSSIFASTGIEVMKSNYLGKNGHIAVACNNVDRAVAYFEAQGVAFNKESAKAKAGKTIAIYFADEIGGFAVHLVQK
jgi:2-dehydro-3-deoxyphosphogluconate aldolase/(4S)-4-hydroxy-2-oxoglutarate aldolase